MSARVERHFREENPIHSPHKRSMQELSSSLRGSRPSEGERFIISWEFFVQILSGPIKWDSFRVKAELMV